MQPLTTLANTDGFVEHPPSGRILCYKGTDLQKIILFWGYALILRPKQYRRLVHLSGIEPLPCQDKEMNKQI